MTNIFKSKFLSINFLVSKQIILKKSGKTKIGWINSGLSVTR